MLTKHRLKGEFVLGHILENTSHADDLDKTLQAISSIKKTSTTEPKYLDPHVEPSPKPLLSLQLLEDEEIQPSEFPFDFEDDSFEDFGNTTNYYYQKIPLLPSLELNSVEESFLKEIVKGITSIIRRELSRETKLYLNVFQLHTPSLTISCTIHTHIEEALYNTMLGINIVSALYHTSRYDNKPLVPLDLFFKSPSGLFLE